MRFLLTAALLLLSECSPGLVFNSSQDMSPDQMLARASHVFVGVIQKQQIEFRPFFHLNVPGGDPASNSYWRILRREVRIEMVLRGVEKLKVVDVYEIFWTGGATGDWNSTHDGDRDLFLLRVEDGRYHVVRDWWRSIFPVTSGPHTRLPLDDSRPLWERIALMNYWIPRNDEGARITYPFLMRDNLGRALSRWRIVKLVRGLVRHPSASVRVPACRELLLMPDQDECWELLSEQDRVHLHDSSELAPGRKRTQDHEASWWWKEYTSLDQRRLFTTINNPKIRAEFCRLYAREYPADTDNGCPADKPPPATIVTDRGDVPLPGDWPR